MGWQQKEGGDKDKGSGQGLCGEAEKFVVGTGWKRAAPGWFTAGGGCKRRWLSQSLFQESWKQPSLCFG